MRAEGKAVDGLNDKPQFVKKKRKEAENRVCAVCACVVHVRVCAVRVHVCARTCVCVQCVRVQCVRVCVQCVRVCVCAHTCVHMCCLHIKCLWKGAEWLRTGREDFSQACFSGPFEFGVTCDQNHVVTGSTVEPPRPQSLPFPPSPILLPCRASRGTVRSPR